MKQAFILLFICSCLKCFSQSATEIYLFDMTIVNGEVHLSNGKNITNHKGYDNQPFFHPTQPIIYYSSFNDSGRSDIKFYNYETNQTNNLTNTREREYSPTVTPDEKSISCIIQRDNGIQDLAKYPIDGGQPIVLINNLKVGYHAWANENELLLFVLDDSADNSIRYYDLTKKFDSVISKNPGRSLHKIPGQNAMSFVQKFADSQYVIMKFDLATHRTSYIATAIHAQDQLCWLQNKMILMGSGNKLFYYTYSWFPVKIDGDASMLKGVTRLATNPQNTKLAVVVTE